MHVRERGQVLAVAVLLCHRPVKRLEDPYGAPASPNASETSAEDGESEDVPVLLHFVEAPVETAAVSRGAKRRRGQSGARYEDSAAVVSSKKRPAPDGRWQRTGKTRTYTARKVRRRTAGAACR